MTNNDETLPKTNIYNAVITVSERLLDDIKAALKSPSMQTDAGALYDVDIEESLLIPLKEFFVVTNDMHMKFLGFGANIMHQSISRAMDIIKGSDFANELGNAMGLKNSPKDFFVDQYAVFSLATSIVATLMVCGIKELRIDHPGFWTPDSPKPPKKD